MANVREARENALGRTVRLLDRYSDRVSNPDEPDENHHQLVLETDGSGAIVGIDGLVYRFGSLAELSVFLEAPLAYQVRAIANQ